MEANDSPKSDAAWDDQDWGLVEEWKAGDIGSLAETCYAAAMECLVNLRWSVVPQMAGAKCPPIKWGAYQQKRPRPRDLFGWYRHWPNAGIALVLGSVSNVAAVDCDNREADDALTAHLGAVPRAPYSISGSGKPHRYHLLFQCPDLPTNAKYCPWHPCLEFRGKGGIIVLPPSLHPSGNRYRWRSGCSPQEIAPPPLPEPILEALREKAARRAMYAPPVDTDAAGPVARVPRIPGIAHETLRFLQSMYAYERGWNGRLFAAACDLAGNGIFQTAATDWLLAGAKPVTPADRENALRTIASAYSERRSPSRGYKNPCRQVAGTPGSSSSKDDVHTITIGPRKNPK
jgi:hypothetical protein